MFETLLQSSYFALFLIIALGFMLGRIQIKGLRPAGIIKMLDLRRPIYRQTAAYGHFGRNDLNLPWEATNKAEALKKYL